jgi:hypothetical protein
MANPGGIVTNPVERPLGSRNNRTKEVIEKITANGFKDPLITLSEISANSKDEHMRATTSQISLPTSTAKWA